MTEPSQPLTLRHFVGGDFVEGRAFIDDLSPATGKVIAKIPRGDELVAHAAVQAAHLAREAWGATSARRRAHLLDAVADLIEARADEWARLECLDTGKPIGLASTVDIPRAVANLRFFAGAVRHDETGCHQSPGVLNYTVRKPLGVVALITPWNLPLYLLTWKVAPALAMGNTVVAKPSELTPLTADALAKAFEEVRAPKGIFNVVHGFGAEAGQPLLEHPQVSAISFTGGTATGRRVAATSAPLFKKLSLELGGKNATLVFADCDLEHAAKEAARAAFTNQGQVCLCGSRVLVAAEIYDAFVERFTTAVNALKFGDPLDAETTCGAVISQAHLDKVAGYVKLAQEEGGRVLTGGKSPDVEASMAGGFFFEPTVIDGLPIDCRTATEEIFGPVVTLHTFDSEDQAVQMANGVSYGLSASVFTRDLDRAHRVSAKLDTGMVWVNTWLLRDLRVPFGGTKDSGVGREGGKHSLEFFSEAQNICIKLSTGSPS